MQEHELRTRVRNPNREFDGFFWRPKNRFLRFVVNKYINIIEVLGYVFGLTMLSAIVYAWTVKHDEWTGWVNSELVAQDSTGEVYVCRVELSGTNVDSVSIGDSVEIQVASACDIPLTFNLTLPDTALSARHVTTAPAAYNAFFDSLTSDHIGREVTAKDQGLYRVTGVARPDVAFELELVPDVDPFKQAAPRLKSILDAAGSAFEPGRPDSVRGVLVARTFKGVFADGVRHLKVELANPFGDSLKQVLGRWVRDSLSARGLVLDGSAYRLNAASTVVVKTLSMDAEAPLDGYVGYKQRSRKMKEYRQKEFKVSGTVRVSSLPEHVRSLARSYTALSGKPLAVRLRVCSYRISWGKKLVRKK